MRWKKSGHRARSFNKVTRSFHRKLWMIMAGSYVIFLAWLLFFAPFRIGTTTAINLVPFKTIWSMTRYTLVTGNDIWYWMVNVPGNIIAFIPFPFIFQLFRKSPFNFRRALLLSTGLPLGIELLQFLFQTGSCDIDDWIFNFAGMMTGYYWIFKKGRRAAG